MRENNEQNSVFEHFGAIALHRSANEFSYHALNPNKLYGK